MQAHNHGLSKGAAPLLQAIGSEKSLVQATGDWVLLVQATGGKVPLAWAKGIRDLSAMIYRR